MATKYTGSVIGYKLNISSNFILYSSIRDIKVESHSHQIWMTLSSYLQSRGWTLQRTGFTYELYIICGVTHISQICKWVSVMDKEVDDHSIM